MISYSIVITNHLVWYRLKWLFKFWEKMVVVQNSKKLVKIGYHTNGSFIGLAYQGKHIVFRFIMEYSSLRDFGP